MHLSRDQDYPSHESIHDEGDWTPPSMLPTVPPRPGMVQRWVRAAHRDGRPDHANWNARSREGWRLRPPETVPGVASIQTASSAGLGLGACIEVEGMVLCEMPAKRNDQRNAWYNKRLQNQETEIQAQLRSVQHPDLPIDRQAKTEVTVRRRPLVQDDDEAA